MIELLDSNWISNILSITFTLVIFLLGIPVLFIQTYVPESLRKYYLELPEYRKQVKSFSYIFIALLVFIVLFGNQGIRFFIAESCCIEGDEHCDGCFIPIVVYYFISLMSFIVLTVITYLIFRKSTGKRLQIKQLIIMHNITKLENDLRTEKAIREIKIEHKSRLDDLYRFFSEGVNRTLYFDEVFILLFKLIHQKEYRYTGKEVKLLFEDILFDTFIHRYNERTQLEIDKLISFSKDLPINCNSTLDREYFSDTLLYQLANNIIPKSRNMNLFSSTINALRILRSREEVFYNIFKSVFIYNKIKYLEIECVYLYNVIEDSINTDEAELNIYELEEVKLSLISYISWFYFYSESSKEKYRKYYMSSNLLIESDFYVAKEKMQRKSEFLTADKISKLIALEKLQN